MNNETILESTPIKDEKIELRRKSERTIKPKIIYLNTPIKRKSTPPFKDEISELKPIIQELKLKSFVKKLQKLVKCPIKNCGFQSIFRINVFCHYLRSHLKENVKKSVSNFYIFF